MFYMLFFYIPHTFLFGFLQCTVENKLNPQVCTLYQWYTDHYAQYKELQQKVLNLHNIGDLKPSGNDSDIYYKYKRLEQYLTDLHVELEYTVTYFEKVRDPRQYVVSTWQRNR